MGLNYIKVNLRQIKNGATGKVEQVTLIDVESDMNGYRGLDSGLSSGLQVYELPYILHALSYSDVEQTEQRGFIYSFPIKF